jgi:hypothetical protein
VGELRLHRLEDQAHPLLAAVDAVRAEGLLEDQGAAAALLGVLERLRLQVGGDVAHELLVQALPVPLDRASISLSASNRASSSAVVGTSTRDRDPLRLTP